MNNKLLSSRLPFISFAPLVLFAATGCGGSTTNPGDTSTHEDSGAPVVDSGMGAVDSQAADTGTAAETGVPVEAGPSVLAIPLASCTSDSYSAAVTIGGTQKFQMLLDTGSTTLGVASNMCSTCGVSPTYTPGTSSKALNQTVDAQYGSGSWVGTTFEDSVSVGSSPATTMNFAAIDSQMMFFEPIQCDSNLGTIQGVLGFGPVGAAYAGTDGFFNKFAAGQGLPNVFATELCQTGGTLWLGGYDPSATMGPVQWTPKSTGMVSTIYHSVNFASMTVGSGGTAIPIGASAPYSFVDTGTSVFLLESTAYTTAAAAIQANAAFTQVFGASFFPAASSSPQPNCVGGVSLTKTQLDAMLPTMTLTFGSNPAIEVQAVATESYLMNIQNEWCTGMLGIDFGGQPIGAILGAAVLKSSVVVFDQDNNRIGFAPHKPCQ